MATRKASPWVYLYRLTSDGLKFYDYGIKGLEDLYANRGFFVAHYRIYG